MPSTCLFIAVTLVPLAALWPSGVSATEIFTHDTLTLHGGPDTRFTTLATLPSGTSITVLWCSGAANWCMVTSGDTRGWAPLKALKFDNSKAASATGSTADANGAASALSAVSSAAPPSLTTGSVGGAVGGIVSAAKGTVASTVSSASSIKVP